MLNRVSPCIASCKVSVMGTGSCIISLAPPNLAWDVYWERAAHISTEETRCRNYVVPYYFRYVCGFFYIYLKFLCVEVKETMPVA